MCCDNVRLIGCTIVLVLRMAGVLVVVGCSMHIAVILIRGHGMILSGKRDGSREQDVDALVICMATTSMLGF